MANITFTVPDDKIDDLVDTLAAAYQYDEYSSQEIKKGGTPMTKPAYVKFRIKQNILRLYKNKKHELTIEANPPGTIDIT